MDLRQFTSEFSLSSAEQDDINMSFLDKAGDFLRDFSVLVATITTLDLSEANQDALKSAFINKWTTFINQVNVFKALMNLDTSVERTVSSIDDFATTSGSDTYRLMGFGYVYSDTLDNSANVFASDFSAAEAEALLATGFSNAQIYLFLKDESAEVGSQWWIFLAAGGTISESVDSEITTGAGLSTVFLYMRNIIRVMQASTVDVDVTIDLLAEYFPQLEGQIDAFSSVFTALALSTS
jgi:hypothetical protein